MRMVVLLLGAAVLVCAETSQEKGKRVIDEAIAALGGDKFLQMQNRVESGRAYSFYRERLTGLAKANIYTRYLPPGARNKIRQVERQAFGKDEDVITLFTTEGGYQVTYRGAKPLPAARYSRYVDSVRRSIFYIIRERLREPGLIFEHKESSIWSNKPVEVVDITDSENNSVTVYVERSTMLPVRQVFFRRNPIDKERDEEVSIFSKYRDVGDGVQWPFNIMSERNGEKVFELYSDSVTIDQKLADDLFVLPSKSKILRPDNVD